MKKVITCLVLILLLTACGAAEPSGVVDFVPYQDEGAEFYGMMSTLHDRGVKVPYDEEDAAAAVILLDGIDLGELETLDGEYETGDTYGGFVTLHVDCGGTEYAIALCKTERVYMDIYQGINKLASYSGDEKQLPIAQFMQLDQAARTRIDGDYMMKLTKEDGTATEIRKDSSLFLHDVLSYYIETEGESGSLSEFDVMLTFGENQYCLNTVTGEIHQDDDGKTLTAVLEEADLMQVMRKLTPYLQ